MMNVLDSRFLSYVDCFGRRFNQPGAFSYRVTSAAAACAHEAGEEFTIEVGEKAREPKQHDVAVRQRDDGFVAEPSTLRIDAGDTVLWHAAGASTGAFAVRGEAPDGVFDSSALTSDTLYTHAFGTAGQLRWVDAHGSGLRGEIVVRDLDANDPEDCRKWMERLAEGVLVTIQRGRATPKRVEIVTGQRVFWLVARTDKGITITDEHFARSGGSRKHQ
jgi:plastocyanin